MSFIIITLQTDANNSIMTIMPVLFSFYTKEICVNGLQVFNAIFTGKVSCLMTFSRFYSSTV